MSIFKRNKEILYNADKSECLVQRAKLKGDCLNIGTKLVVPQDYLCIVGKNGKTYDIFETGEYYLSYQNLPLICKKCNINKKQNTPITKINADLYYINLKPLSINWESYKSVAGNRAEGFMKYSICGKCKFHITNPSEFMQSLLNELSYIKTGEAEKLLDSWICDTISKLFDKNLFTINQIINNDKIIFDKLHDVLDKLFEMSGLCLDELLIEQYHLPPKYQKLNEEIMKQSLLNSTENKEVENLRDIEVAHENKLENNFNETELTDRKNKFVPFGNMQINFAKTVVDKNSEALSQNDNESTVDLNSEKIYNDNISQVVCKVCGTVNDNSQDFCIKCGNFLRR